MDQTLLCQLYTLITMLLEIKLTCNNRNILFESRYNRSNSNVEIHHKHTLNDFIGINRRNQQTIYDSRFLRINSEVRMIIRIFTRITQTLGLLIRPHMQHTILYACITLFIRELILSITMGESKCCTQTQLEFTGSYRFSYIFVINTIMCKNQVVTNFRSRLLCRKRFFLMFDTGRKCSNIFGSGQEFYVISSYRRTTGYKPASAHILKSLRNFWADIYYILALKQRQIECL